jgi:hypothetical protein
MYKKTQPNNNQSRNKVHKWNQKQLHTPVTDCNNLPRDTRFRIITLVARPLLTPVAQKLKVRTRCIHEQILCSFTNITSQRNHLLLFVMHLAMHILTRKYRIRQQYTDCNKISEHRKCLSVTSAHGATKQLKLRPYRFQAVHQLQQRDTSTRTQYWKLVSSVYAWRCSCVVVRDAF